METREMVARIYDALDDKKAQDIQIIDITEISGFADYFIVASASNQSQLVAMQDAVDEAMYTNKGGKDEPLYSWFHIRFNLNNAQCKKISEATDGKISLLCAYKCLGTLGYSEAEGQVFTITDNMVDGFTSSFVKK